MRPTGGAATTTAPQMAPAPRLPRPHAMSNTATLEHPGTAAGRALCATLRTCQAGVHTRTSTEAACYRRTMTELLLIEGNMP